MLTINQEFIDAENNRNISGTAYQFLMSIYDSFQKYDKKEDKDPVSDKLCLRTCMMNLSDEKFDEFFKEYSELLGRYMGIGEGKLRSISIISAPVEEEEQ